MYWKRTLSSLFFFIVSLGFAQQKKVTQYFEDIQNGKKHLEKEYYVSDITGQIEGHYVEYFFSGDVKAQGNFKAGNPIGNWQYFFENGKIKQKVTFNSERLTSYQFFFENGNLKTELSSIKKVKEGRYTKYFENGSVKLTGYYDKGIKDSLWTEYAESGELISSATYKFGKGYHRGYFLDGQLKHEGPVYKDWSEGVWKYYDKSGPLQSKGLEMQGVRNGFWQFVP